MEIVSSVVVCIPPGSVALCLVLHNTGHKETVATQRSKPHKMSTYHKCSHRFGGKVPVYETLPEVLS